MCIYQQNIKGRKNVQFMERLKLEGAEWVRSQNFWLFGTATFKDGSRLTASDATNDAKHFFNILDRQILKRKETMQGMRLDRLVFFEHGRLGANTHFHFFIKGRHLSQYKTIAKYAPIIWQERISKAHNLLLKDNIGLDDTRSEYCWKEIKSYQRDVLLTECCHLSNS